jgi:hypothetical protein
MPPAAARKVVVPSLKNALIGGSISIERFLIII